MQRDMRQLIGCFQNDVSIHPLDMDEEKKLIQSGIDNPRRVKGLVGVTLSFSSHRLDGIGFRNESKGVEFYSRELGSPLTIGKKDIVRIAAHEGMSDGCHVFNDMLDYITFSTSASRLLFSFNRDYDCLILNHAKNFNHLVSMTDIYGTVVSFMPNNDYGRTLSKTLGSRCKSRFYDISLYYKGYVTFRDMVRMVSHGTTYNNFILQ